MESLRVAGHFQVGMMAKIFPGRVPRRIALPSCIIASNVLGVYWRFVTCSPVDALRLVACGRIWPKSGQNLTNTHPDRSHNIIALPRKSDSLPDPNCLDTSLVKIRDTKELYSVSCC